jgi:hypothetical protein
MLGLVPASELAAGGQGVQSAEKVRVWAEFFADIFGQNGAPAIEGFKGSDVRVSDSAASLPGGGDSSAPHALDLNGETSRLEIPFNFRSIALEQPRSSSSRSLGPINDLPISDGLVYESSVSASNTQADAASPTSISPARTVTSLFGGSVRDSQVSSATDWDSFRSEGAVVKAPFLSGKV